MRKTKGRMFIILLGITVIWSGLFLRLLWIQFGFTDYNLSLGAVKQRQQSVVLNNGRGQILDRNGYSFTGEQKQALVLFSFAEESLSQKDTKQRIAQIVGVSTEKLPTLSKSKKEPSMLRDEKGRIINLSERQAKEINDLQIPGILALSVTDRYRENEVAKHVIGYTNQNPIMVKTVYQKAWQEGQMSMDTIVGAAGLERSFDRFLQGMEETRLSYFLDGQGKPLDGLDMRYTTNTNELYPLSLVTTLDKDIQEQMEKVADQTAMKEGAMVVLDAKTRDILAMVSRPLYDQSHVDVEHGAWQNHAIKQMAPGSIYKTIVAAAALGEGIISPTEEFECRGEYGKYGFSCWRKEGHGILTLEEAYSQSCNIAFAEIAKKVGSNTIEEYAKKLGVTMLAGWSTDNIENIKNFRQVDGEDHGVIFAKGVPKTDEGVLIQTAIGQRDVRMTPLQAANMMVTILQNGKWGEARLVQDITYQNGLTFYHFPIHQQKEWGIDQVTAYKLQKMMRKVVEEGTGKPLATLEWEVAGKSGTAQVTKKGKPRNHQWFVGYTPALKPRYAIAIVFENESITGRHKATEAFAQAVEGLTSLEGRFSEPRRESLHSK